MRGSQKLRRIGDVLQRDRVARRLDQRGDGRGDGDGIAGGDLGGGGGEGLRQQPGGDQIGGRAEGALGRVIGHGAVP